jgi:hypothetical protein
MKIDFSQKITGPDGNELDFHLGQVALNALNAPGKEPLPFDQAILRGNLALKVADGGEHETTPEEAALIRSLLPNVWAPVVVARAAKMLEG